LAFASYFSRNITAGRQLLQGFDAEAFKNVLQREVVGIALDGTATASPEAEATLDLLTRIFARFYPRIAIVALDSKAQSAVQLLTRLAKRVNPRIAIVKSLRTVTRCVVVGRTTVTAIAAPDSTFYLGSDNWIIRLSSTRPVSSGRSRNPLGAGAAACFGAANIFRVIFAKQLPSAKPDVDIRMSALDLNPRASRPRNPAFHTADLGELHLVGAGAIGNGVFWALSRLPCRGVLHVIDHELIALSNLQRYVMTVVADENSGKTELARIWLSGNGLIVYPHAKRWDEYMATRTDWKLENVAVCVDNAFARIQIQSSLPRRIINGWTQQGEFGISRHTFVGDDACLACLYIPKGKTPNEDEIILHALGFPAEQLMEIRTRLDTNAPTEHAFLERISASKGIPMELLERYLDKPLRTLYVEGLCSSTLLDFGNAEDPNSAEVPMAFQSALAGILMTASALARASESRHKFATITQLDLLQQLPAIVSHPRKKDHAVNCICKDKDFIAVYKAKYRT
jgi:hypothetical protein